MQSILATPDPRRERFTTQLADGTAVRVMDDPLSDRLRCDHPSIDVDGRALANALRRAAARRDRGRIVALVDPSIAEGMSRAGFREEAQMPGFYNGDRDCVVMGAFPDPERRDLAAPLEVRKVERLVEAAAASPRPRPEVETDLATPHDAEGIAQLLTATFPEYPTPSDPQYVAHAIEDGTPFRIVRKKGEIVACASADLVPKAATAELTDCATRPAHRGNGFMQAILLDLMDDLRDLDYPTAFTLARARIPGVNLAFYRLGFELCGTMAQSCRIGEGIEDMNVWSRWLAESA
jgi:putative beta-lysine N-acetyltransferase